MGSGIARQIRERYPEAYEADCQTTPGDIRKLGAFSWVKAKDGKFIYNCYSQYRYGREKRHTNYEAVYTGLSSIEQNARELGLTTLSLPYNMGCMLGGGSWRIVSVIIDGNRSDKMYTLSLIGRDIPNDDDLAIARQANGEWRLLGTAKAAGHDVVELNYDLAGNGKANILKTAGSVKLVAKKNGPILGIHMVGSRVGELLAEAQLIYNWEADAADVAQHIHAHPTLSEAMGEAHLALAGKPLHAHG